MWRFLMRLRREDEETIIFWLVIIVVMGVIIAVTNHALTPHPQQRETEHEVRLLSYATWTA